MKRPTALICGLLLATLLGGCTLTHYEARGEFGDTPAVLHWKEGDSTLTLWRCGALPIPLARGIQGQDETFASDDQCVRFYGRFEAGESAVLHVDCEDPRYPAQGQYMLAETERWRQILWFGRMEPATPDPCNGTDMPSP
ncbi:hypothetical protein IC757_00750 [Wenzhouxiangella sp. AB-CW3]|uniref:hypothetical protein n=1 Tax=Wenzhouxiangella sp. AB-CW3 TaxID=2771012 RepID=UPI00168B51C3|nr:hypothetical protein [Wenzhouxiangella sp. AB-CW3]QOC22730.1 hypothetical protein IC757_00750 [Wenzhouxiangella sp. AB-CW3]